MGNFVEEDENILPQTSMLDIWTAPERHRAMQESLPMSRLPSDTTQGYRTEDNAPWEIWPVTMCPSGSKHEDWQNRNRGRRIFPHMESTATKKITCITEVQFCVTT